VEYKFKIWDNKTNSFLNNGKSMSLQDIVDCSEFSTIIDAFSTALLVSDKRDINNTLITEGDLVEVIINKQPHGFGKFEVIYKDSAFRLKEIEQNWAMILQEDNCLADFEEIKIIGNIFEKAVDNSTSL
jgi:hypothetical protein